MVLLEAALAVGLAGLIIYGTIMLLTRGGDPESPAVTRGEWRATHYEVDGATRVVLQKVSPGGTNKLDEHVVATIPVDDPEYDAKFLAAMSTARERRSLFETEEE